MRRERNRITARQSRDRKAAYIMQLEMDVNRLNERVAQLEYDMTTRSIMMTGTTSTFTTTAATPCNSNSNNSSNNNNPFSLFTDDNLGIDHEAMGFFD